MTTHELGRLLLAQADVPVYQIDEDGETEIVGLDLTGENVAVATWLPPAREPKNYSEWTPMTQVFHAMSKQFEERLIRNLYYGALPSPGYGDEA